MTMEISGIPGLVHDLEKAATSVLPVVRAIVEKSAGELRDDWKTNARATAGKHGKLYPSSITSEDVPSFGAITFDIGPDSSKKQGGMGRGFEYGSVNQPPHLDGLHATEATEPAFHHAIDLAVEGLL